MQLVGTVSFRGGRALCASDIDRVVAIDRAHTGHTRWRFFEKRFAAAEAKPDDFVHLGVMRGGSLRGFIMVHLEHGEFGREEMIGVLDAVGVEPETQERGVGQSLIEELVEILHGMGVRSLQSQGNWTNHSLLRFFEASAFSLSPRVILERSVSDGLAETLEEV
jgi:ribosomal protein S18 acetylase RimI-like enzyme